MKISLRLALSASSLVVLAGASGCGSSDEASGAAFGEGAGAAAPAPSPPPASNPGAAERAIAEADIIQLDGGRLYAMSRSGSVSVVDVSSPGRLYLLGKANVAGEPFEMYRRGDLLVTMTNAAYRSDGSAYPQTGSTTTGSTNGSKRDPNAGAAVIVLDVRNPTNMKTVATFPVPGEIADSRVVGDVLYLATYENAKCFKCGPAPRTMVTTFNLATPTEMFQVDQAYFQSNAPDGYNLPWGSNWKRSIFATTERLYIGGHADIEPSQLSTSTHKEGIIDVLDITDPTGHLAAGARLEVAGAMLSRWQLDERNGILRVVSQKGAGRTANGIGAPEVDTFTIESTQSFVPLGHTTLQLPRQEGLRTVRFDADRAYAITYNQTDPLFTIDLANPAAPQVRGELHMPGFMFHLEPHGDRVIGLGIDRDDPFGSLNVSLFDVSEMDAPKMIKRVSFASTQVYEDHQILNEELAEDQDRIQKAFRVLDGGLVVVPFSNSSGSWSGGDTCSTPGSGVQLVEWKNDTLFKRALLPMTGNPRRAFKNGGELVAVSDSNVTAFSLANLSVAKQTATLVIDSCESKTVPSTNEPQGVGDDGYYGSNTYPYGTYGSPRYRHGCSSAGGMAPGAASAAGLFAAFGAVALLRRRRAAGR